MHRASTTITKREDKKGTKRAIAVDSPTRNRLVRRLNLLPKTKSRFLGHAIILIMNYEL